MALAIFLIAYIFVHAKVTGHILFFLVIKKVGTTISKNQSGIYTNKIFFGHTIEDGYFEIYSYVLFTTKIAGAITFEPVARFFFIFLDPYFLSSEQIILACILRREPTLVSRLTKLI